MMANSARPRQGLRPRADHSKLEAYKKRYRKLVADFITRRTTERIHKSGLMRAVHASRKEVHGMLTLQNYVNSDKRYDPLQSQLVYLMSFNCSIKKDIGNQKIDLKEIDLVLKQTERNVYALRKQIKPIREKESPQNLEKRLQLLENNLDRHMKQYGAVTSENKKYREELVFLLKERQCFMREFNQLVKQLHEGKNVLMHLIEELMKIEEAREGWRTKQIALYGKAKDKLNTHKEEMRKVIHTKNRLNELAQLIHPKNQRRIMAIRIEEIRNKRTELRKLVEDQLFDYGNMYATIAQFVGSTNILKISQIFMYREYKNFASFSYVNMLNKDIESLGNEIFALNKRIEFRKNYLEQARRRHVETLNKLEEFYTQINSENNTLEAFINKQGHTMLMVKCCILTILRALKCKKRMPELKETEAQKIMLDFRLIETMLYELLARMMVHSSSSLDSKVLPDAKVNAHLVSNDVRDILKNTNQSVIASITLTNYKESIVSMSFDD